MTEPTDSEIIALADETRTAEGGANGYVLPISFARAVLDKWGTPQPTQAQAAPQSGAKSFQTYAEANAYSRGYYAGKKAATQAQAGAVPLTKEQIEAAAKKLAERMEYPWEFMPEPGRKNMRKHAQDVIGAAYPLGGKQ